MYIEQLTKTSEPLSIAVGGCIGLFITRVALLAYSLVRLISSAVFTALITLCSLFGVPKVLHTPESGG